MRGRLAPDVVEEMEGRLRGLMGFGVEGGGGEDIVSGVSRRPLFEMRRDESRYR
jgi:hypothetical protein